MPAELRELLSVPGVSGFETPVVDWLVSRLPAGVPTERDAIGNLVARFGTAGPELLVIVHTDEVGFVVSGVRDDGAVYLTAVGGWDLAALGGRQVDVHVGAGRSVPGVVITVPPHLDRGLGSPPAWLEGEQVVVDVGVDDAAGVAALGVEVLQPVTLTRRQAVLPGGPIVGRGLDNRFGCYLLLQLARQLAAEPPTGARVTLAWASQEEVGFRGPLALARRERFDAVIAVDAFPADRRPGARGGASGVRLGRGPVVRGVDLTGVGSVAFRDGLVALAGARGIPVQPAYARGHNQASVFQTAAAIALDLPIAYLHAAVESLHPHDLEAAGALLHAITSYANPEALWTR
jgi:endoglucanase